MQSSYTKIQELKNCIIIFWNAIADFKKKKVLEEGRTIDREMAMSVSFIDLSKIYTYFQMIKYNSNVTIYVYCSTP